MPEIAIRRLLCPTDFSAFSRRALNLGLALAERHGGEIRAVHVVPPRSRHAPSSRISTPAAPEAWDPRLDWEELLRSVAPAQARHVPVSAEMLEGEVVDAIVAEAAAWAADLVVMGSHGLSGHAGWTMGSVAEEVLHHAPCPVLVVPRGAVGVGEYPRGFARILCPLDFSEPARRSLEIVLALAREWGARLTLLHVLEWFPAETAADEPELCVPEYQMDLSQAARERLRRAVPCEASDWCLRDETVAVGRPHREILRVAGEREADLIALGVHGRRAIDRRLFGATVCHVLREATCPVLAVRPS